MTHWKSSPSELFLRTIILGLSATTAFALFESWPRRLPRWLQRWVLQVVAVGVFMPVTTLLIYVLSTPRGAPPFWEVSDRLTGWMILTFFALLLAPWGRRKPSPAIRSSRSHSSGVSSSGRRSTPVCTCCRRRWPPISSSTRWRTCRPLVDAGSPDASTVLRSLVAYLRAAVPVLPRSSGEPAATIERELQLVRPYLELMQMPDRLQYAMNHGIDPSEEGGRIDIDIERRGERCLVRVTDTGAGLQQSGSGLGTGLTTLRERLQLIFGDAAQVRLMSGAPRGVAVTASERTASSAPASSG